MKIQQTLRDVMCGCSKSTSLYGKRTSLSNFQNVQLNFCVEALLKGHSQVWAQNKLSQTLCHLKDQSFVSILDFFPDFLVNDKRA